MIAFESIRESIASELNSISQSSAPITTVITNVASIISSAAGIVVEN